MIILLQLLAMLVYHFLISGNDVSNDINSAEDPDIHRNVSELITSKGYPVENHIARTDDGYILSLQRIPYGKLNKEMKDRMPVLLQHGVLSSSSDWVINFPHQSLGFILADSGYDAWLGNTRGGAYSRQHVNFTTDTKEFWNFSLDELAEYDLPAMIDYILNVTKKNNLIYIGHSQGTTLAFALLSQSPQYNKKIKLFVALAPEVELSHMKPLIRYLVPVFDYFKVAMEMFDTYEILPNSPAVQFFKRNFCGFNTTNLCENIIFSILGTDRTHLNQTRMPVYTEKYPNGGSLKNIDHFSQMIASKKFQKYDYGKENWKYYNQDSPPEYNVSNIVTPTALFYAVDDPLAGTEDISLLEKKLNSLIYSNCVSWKDFAHYDFVLAKDARKLVYDELLSLMKQYKNNEVPFKIGYPQRKTCQ